MEYSYTNGNTTVNLYEDGTKIRLYEGIPYVIHPESIDVKITNQCSPTIDNPICFHCHEMSTINGKHADLNKLFDQFKNYLTSGVEICIGGGDPFSHPDLFLFLQKLKCFGLVANITVNQKHIKQHKQLIQSLINEKLINGLGISYSNSKYINDIKEIMNDNVVFHLIMGVNKVTDIEELFQFNKPKILVLGYKQVGFGINYYNNEVERNKYQWYIGLAKYFKRDLILAFDNLAIEQLKLSRYFTNEAWNKFYMGRDGKFTCYIDAVKEEFAKSSTAKERVSFNEMNLETFFKLESEKVI
jgi:hypothetical protein